MSKQYLGAAEERETAPAPSREELLQGIRPGMKLDKAFFLRIYGYEISWPGFAEQALVSLEQAGCSKAREHYDSIVQEYEAQYRAEIQDAARWYRAECERQETLRR